MINCGIIMPKFSFCSSSIIPNSSIDLTRFAIQAKGPDGKWTRKPLAYRESNNVHLLIARPPEICVNLVFKHIHASCYPASTPTAARGRQSYRANIGICLRADVVFLHRHPPAGRCRFCSSGRCKFCPSAQHRSEGGKLIGPTSASACGPM